MNYDKRAYELADHNPVDYNQALTKIREWDYNKDAPIALGALYKKENPTFEDRFIQPQTEAQDRQAGIDKILEEAI